MYNQSHEIEIQALQWAIKCYFDRVYNSMIVDALKQLLSPRKRSRGIM